MVVSTTAEQEVLGSIPRPNIVLLGFVLKELLCSLDLCLVDDNRLVPF